MAFDDIILLSYKILINSLEFLLFIPKPNSPWIALLFNFVSSTSRLNLNDLTTFPSKNTLSLKTSVLRSFCIS